MRIGLRFQIIQFRLLLLDPELLSGLFQFYMVIDMSDHSEEIMVLRLNPIWGETSCDPAERAYRYAALPLIHASHISLQSTKKYARLLVASTEGNSSSSDLE